MQTLGTTLPLTISEAKLWDIQQSCHTYGRCCEQEIHWCQPVIFAGEERWCCTYHSNSVERISCHPFGCAKHPRKKQAECEKGCHHQVPFEHCTLQCGPRHLLGKITGVANQPLMPLAPPAYAKQVVHHDSGDPCHDQAWDHESEDGDNDKQCNFRSKEKVGFHHGPVGRICATPTWGSPLVYWANGAHYAPQEASQEHTHANHNTSLSNDVCQWWKPRRPCWFYGILGWSKAMVEIRIQVVQLKIELVTAGPAHMGHGLAWLAPTFIKI